MPLYPLTNKKRTNTLLIIVRSVFHSPTLLSRNKVHSTLDPTHSWASFLTQWDDSTHHISPPSQSTRLWMCGCAGDWTHDSPRIVAISIYSAYLPASAPGSLILAISSWLGQWSQMKACLPAILYSALLQLALIKGWHLCAKAVSLGINLYLA